MTYIGIIRGTDSTDYPIGSTLYGTCSDAASTQIKTVTFPSSFTGNNLPFDTLVHGITIHVYMQESNTASNPKLKAGSTIAKSIMRYGTTAVGTTVVTSWTAGTVVSFTYDGTNDY